jgi:cell fate (sporulation/competence/biofilm development) regulator YmcA (YheA/YmcA/DUF963 family)
MQTFIEAVEDDLPSEAIFRELGAGKTDVNDLLKRLVTDLNLN